MLRSPFGDIETRRGGGKNAVGLEQRRASFGASLREAPKDEACFFLLSTTCPHAESARYAAFFSSFGCT